MRLTLAVGFRGIAIDRYILSKFRGTKLRVEVRQCVVENFRPEIYVIPNTEAPGNEVLQGCGRSLARLRPTLEDMLAKYHITTAGVELARARSAKGT